MSDALKQKNFVVLSIALFAFMLGWSVGLAKPLMDFMDPQSEAVSYIINKGVLAAVIVCALWKMNAFAEVGYRRGAGFFSSIASFMIGIPLMALGIFSLMDPNRAPLTPMEISPWVVAIFLIAFTEETVFRGVMWKALESASVWTRAITTSSIFGLIHFIPAGMGDFGWGIAAVYGLSAAGFGMVFAAMRERAGSIWTVVVAHILFDIAAISQAGNVSQLLEPGMETYIRFLTAAFIFSAWGATAILLINRRDRKLAAT